MIQTHPPRPTIPMGPTSDRYDGPILLASGHRLFFLFAALYAALALPMWLLAWRGFLPLTSTWHGHEMIFGFAIAAIAGFLLAAVPKWTNSKPFQGPLVALLVGLWLLGRVAMWLPGLALLDLLFVPVLAAVLGRQILRAGNRRNYGVPVLLMALWGIDVLFQFGQPNLALRVATYLVTTLIALIAGRIVPTFTRNALKMAGDPQHECVTPRWLDMLAVPTVLAVAVTELVAPMSQASGIAALLAAMVLGARMLGWRTWQTRRLPIVWILHVGYAFVPVGLALKAVADLGGPIGTFAALHALTAGAIGVMILAVASRAALGHAGLPLQVSRPTIVAYVLVTLGAVLRVALAHPHAVLAAGILWSLGYAVFAVVYWPILTRPRVDGQPG
jgi:uncharacterized protein involved in response to NO